MYLPNLQSPQLANLMALRNMGGGTMGNSGGMPQRPIGPVAPYQPIGMQPGLPAPVNPGGPAYPVQGGNPPISGPYPMPGQPAPIAPVRPIGPMPFQPSPVGGLNNLQALSNLRRPVGMMR